MLQLTLEDFHGRCFFRQRSLLFARIIILFLLLNLWGAFYSPLFAYSHFNSRIQWMDYSKSAFEEARSGEKPIFMLITAIWCYWCKVFEKEVLEDKEVSAYLNKNYFNIYLDYDKRKDVARKYVSTGLPYIVIISPEGEELVGVGGFIEKSKFLENLKKTAEYVKTEYEPIITEKNAGIESSSGVVYPKKDDLERIVRKIEIIIKNNYDDEYGGFGRSEKKAHAETLLYLMELYRDTGNEQWIGMVKKSLDYMGGIKRVKDMPAAKINPARLLSLYRDREQNSWVEKVGELQKKDRLYSLHDDIEGAFFRYTLLRDWSLPHFEKMLLENAEIIRAYLIAYKLTKRKEFKERAISGLNYIIDRLYDRSGYFYGSQVADDVYYHLNAAERKNVKPPVVDKTGYSLSNAKMVLTLLEAGRVLENKEYSEKAKKVLNFHIKNNIGARGALAFFNRKENKGMLDGQLADNAWMALALFEGYKATKDILYLKTGENILNFLLSKLYDVSKGGFFERNSSDGEFYRKGEMVSFNKQSPENGVAAYTLIVAYQITGTREYLLKAEETVGAFVDEYPDASEPYLQMAARRLIDINKKTGGQVK